VVPLAGNRCRRCGGPAAEPDGECLTCLSAPPPQQATVIWGEYDGTLRRALLALKHHGHDELARRLGQRLSSRVASSGLADGVDTVTAVPSHSIHRLRRGWSAAELLAREVARELELPFARLLRRHGTGRQAGRTRVQRRALDRRSFAARRVPRSRSVLLVDDVITTGTTLRRAVQALLAGGATTVACAALSLAPDPRRLLA
jgi:predicted amidophosphoribosyltransferase